MTRDILRGVYPILVTPFDARGRLDIESLRSLVEFQIAWGAHGVGVALGSEVFKLTEEERLLVTRTVVDQAGGRVKVVINTGGDSDIQAVAYSLAAQEAGADALMCRPPVTMPADNEGLRRYFKALSDAVRIPIFMQDTSAPSIPAGLAVQIARESPHCGYIKVESLPTTVKVAQAGDLSGAYDVFYRRILPVNRLQTGGWAYFYHVNKEILRRRGAITTNVVREPMSPVDAWTLRELDEVIEQLYG